MSKTESDARGMRIGIVGAGRTRQGLGPFLARWFEKSGAVLHGVSGRDPVRNRDAAVSLAEQLRHPVAPYDDADSLARNVDALVVACPVEGHAAALDAALAAGVPCLCEKPFVSWSEPEVGLARVDAFRQRGLLLAENCQWPFALAALDELHPELRGGAVRSLAMRLSPAWPGHVMVEDSLSHVLSLLQALVALPQDARAVDVRQTDAGDAARENVVRFSVVGGIDEVAVELHLQCCPQQPRPAWFAVDGARLDRQLGDNYAISFRSADGRVANVQDPLDALVYGFVANLKANHRERTDALADAIALRIRLYSGVLSELRGAAG